MDRLFLRVYLHVLAGVLLTGLLVRVLIVPHVDARLTQNIADTFDGPVAVMADMLAEQYAQRHDLEGAVARVASRFRVPVAVVPRAGLELAGGALARLDSGAVVRTEPPFKTTLYIRIEGTGQILRIGPLPLVPPVGGRPGTAIFFLFVVGLSLGVLALLRPLRRQLTDLRGTAEALGRGELGARAEVGSRDAIGTLAATLNHMAGELQRAIADREELLHMTSHELRTPIQRMHFSLERAREAAFADARGRALDRIERDLTELDELIGELLTYVRLKERRAPDPAPVDARGVVVDLCESLTGVAGATTLIAPEPGADPLPVGVEARLLGRAASNLVVNALRHARSRVEVTVRREARAIHIQVDDDGPGIPEPDRERIFEPFHRLDDARSRASRGFGLGLAIVRRIAEVHGGSVAAQASALGGARLELSFPACPDPPALYRSVSSIDPPGPA